MFSSLRAMRTYVLIAFSALSLSSWAALPDPKGPIVLSISGKIGESTKDGIAQFDMAMLEKLPQQTFETNTPWDKAAVKFTGPLLRDVLAAVKAQGQTLQALAINDYKTSIPIADAMQHDMIIAHKINGQPIPIRTKGPLFIVYPFDTKPELKSSTYYGRSAWQLKSLRVE